MLKCSVTKSAIMFVHNWELLSANTVSKCFMLKVSLILHDIQINNIISWYELAETIGFGWYNQFQRVDIDRSRIYRKLDHVDRLSSHNHYLIFKTLLNSTYWCMLYCFKVWKMLISNWRPDLKLFEIRKIKKVVSINHFGNSVWMF